MEPGRRFILNKIAERVWEKLEIIRRENEWKNTKYDKKPLFWSIKTLRREEERKRRINISLSKGIVK